MRKTWTRFLPPFVGKWLENRPELQRVIGNTGWLFADKVFRMGVGMVITVWMTRYLGPDRFGLLNYAIAFVALFSVMASLGLEGIVIRELVRRPEERQKILGSAMVLKTLGGILTTFFSVVTIIATRNDATAIMVAVIASATIFQALEVFDFWFQSRLEAKYSVIAKNVAFFLVSALKVVLILKKAPLIAFAVAWTAEFAIASLALAVAFVGTGNSLGRIRARRRECIHLLGNSWPLMLSTLSVIIYMKIDQVMLGEILGSTAVGIYSAAAKLSEIWYFIPMIVTSSVMPSLIRIRDTDEAFYRRRLQRLFRVLSALALSIAVPMTFLATPLVNLLYGERFAAAGPILAVHIWASIFVFVGVAQSAWDLAENYTRLSLLRTTGGAVVNVILNLFLIPRFGAMGAAVATVISYACSWYLFNLLSSKTRPIFVCQTRSFLFFR